jgi:hypothetical protein
MATLENNTLNNVIRQKEQTITFKTKDTYVENDIIVNNIVKDGSITQNQGNTGNYAQNSTLTLNSGGSIYINEGWLPNTQISLDSLLPDEENMIIVEAIRNGYHGWDDKGVKIVGNMPDVNPEFQGGGLTLSKGTQSISNTVVELTPSGTITDSTTQSTYGITKTQPQNINNYLSISTDLSIPTPKVSIKDISATRAAVTYSQNYKGYLDKKQEETALASTTEKTSLEVNVTMGQPSNTFGTYYIPYTNKPEVAGGVASLTPDVSYSNPTVTISGNISTSASTYGITETRPTTGSENTNYIILSKATTNKTEGTITPKVEGTVSAVTVTQNAGLVSKSNNEVKKEAQTISQNGTQQTTTTKITNNTKNYYIPIVTGTPTVTSTVTNAVVSNSIASNTQIALTTTTPTNPADYIELTLTSNASPGSVATTPKITIENAGLIKNGTIKGTETTESVTVKVTNPKYYIRKYDGSYTIG